VAAVLRRCLSSCIIDRVKVHAERKRMQGIALHDNLSTLRASTYRPTDLHQLWERTWATS
jgi:hypothetical protein